MQLIKVSPERIVHKTTKLFAVFSLINSMWTYYNELMMERV